MPGGVNHAKKIVIDEANCLVDKLKNGGSNKIETQNEALGLIVKMITPLYAAEFVTIEELEKCQDKHKVIIDGKVNKDNKDGVTELSVGPMRIKGRINIEYVFIIICMIGVAYAIFKAEGWL